MNCEDRTMPNDKEIKGSTTTIEESRIGVSNGYDPIIGVPPTDVTSTMALADTSLLDASGTTAATSSGTPDSVAISSQDPGATKSNGKTKTKGFSIVVNSLDMYYENATGGWTQITADPYPFTVDTTIINQPRVDVDKDEQYVITCPANSAYSGTFPAKLEIKVTLSDGDGSNPTTAIYEVVRNS